MFRRRAELTTSVTKKCSNISGYEKPLFVAEIAVLSPNCPISPVLVQTPVISQAKSDG